MKSQTELNDAKGQISVKTIEGSEDSRAVDISTLEGNKVATQQEVEKPVIQVEQMPQFPGGDKELMAYISRSLKYPPIATENGIEGRVAIRFVVSNKGDVTNVEILKGLDPSCDKEAMRVIRSMPRWIPGMQNGRKVAVYYTLPISYRLQR